MLTLTHSDLSKKNRKDTRWWATILLVVTCFFCALNTACVHYIHPIGNWAEPTDLALYDDSLKDIRIQLSCISSNRKGLIPDDNDESSDAEPCTSIAEGLTAADAVIVRDKPDLVVQYKEMRKEKSNCSWGVIPFYFSLTLWPCRSDATSHASLVISNVSTGNIQEWPIAVKVHQYFGLGSLAMRAMDTTKDPTPRQYHQQLAENFMTYIRNKVYTASPRDRGL